MIDMMKENPKITAEQMANQEEIDAIIEG